MRVAIFLIIATKVRKNLLTYCTFTFQIINVPLPSDSLISTSTDSLSQKDSLSLGNFFQEMGTEFFEVFIKPAKNSFEGAPIDHWENIWQFTFLLSTLLLLAILKSSFGNRMNQFLGAILATRQLRQLMREEGFLYHPFSILLLVNSGIIYALIVYKIANYFHWYPAEGTGINFFLIILSASLLILFFKVMILRFMEFLTDTDLGQRENRYTWVMFHQIGGIILLPIAAIMLFGKTYWVIPGIIFTLTILIIFLIFRIGKGFLQAGQGKVYFLHLFIYLCALELIPLIVLLKVLVTQINGFNE